jgi:ABC-type xylose transport system permease subunit
MNQVSVVPALIAVVIGIFLVIIGLSPDLSCGMVRALGGQCIVLFGNLAIQAPYGIVPTIVLLVGAMLILIGAVDAYTVSMH